MSLNFNSPKWFEMGSRMLWPMVNLVLKRASRRSGNDVNLNIIPQLAAIQLLHCLDSSSDINRKGRHAVALCLIRQCVEALTIVEVGLHNPGFGDPLLRDWWSGRKTQGGIRKQLETEVWGDYGTGLWNEPWANYFGELAKAVQPYAHYTIQLQGWQMVAPSGEKLSMADDGSLLARMKFGIATYDDEKATRITLLHCLIGWSIGRLILATGGDPELDEGEVIALGDALAESELLLADRESWSHVFLANTFDGIAL